MTDLTTRQLAERIARAAFEAAVWNQWEQQLDFDPDACSQAVLRTLREHHVWLHRTVQDAEGVIDGEAPSEVLPEVEA